MIAAVGKLAKEECRAIDLIWSNELHVWYFGNVPHRLKPNELLIGSGAEDGTIVKTRDEALWAKGLVV